jgi:DNA-binding response OmpR family regulator
MARVHLIHQTEGVAVLQHDLASLGYEVEISELAGYDEALAQPADAFVVEAAAQVEETRRVVESPARPSRTPIIVVARGEQLPGFDATWPVDDFIILPVAVQELGLRLRRALWRKTGLDSANTLRAGDLVVDLANYKVFVAEQPVSLTFKEFELLRFLMTNPGKVFTREALLNRVWGYEYYGGARTVDVHVRRLRSKVETGGTVYVETVRNVGYRFPADSLGG